MNTLDQHTGGFTQLCYCICWDLFFMFTLICGVFLAPFKFSGDIYAWAHNVQKRKQDAWSTEVSKNTVEYTLITTQWNDILDSQSQWEHIWSDADALSWHISIR